MFVYFRVTAEVLVLIRTKKFSVTIYGVVVVVVVADKVIRNLATSELR